MTDTELISEWAKYYAVCYRKMNALAACLENNGERVTQGLLKKLGLGSALDVVKACKDDAARATRP